MYSAQKINWWYTFWFCAFITTLLLLNAAYPSPRNQTEDGYVIETPRYGIYP